MFSRITFLPDILLVVMGALLLMLPAQAESGTIDDLEMNKPVDTEGTVNDGDKEGYSHLYCISLGKRDGKVVYFFNRQECPNFQYLSALIGACSSQDKKSVVLLDFDGTLPEDEKTIRQLCTNKGLLLVVPLSQGK